MRARLVNPPEGTSVCYRAHVQDVGWMDEVCDGAVAGTIGRSLRVEAVRIRIRIPFHTFTDNGCTNWIPGFDLQFPICDPYRPVWLEQFSRWFASGFSSYFIGLPRSSDKIQVFNPDINKDVPAQIYERGVLHIWSDEPTGIASMRLGEWDRAVNGVPQSLNAPMPNDFAQIWGSQGGLPVFGQTVSDAGFHAPNDRFSQYFERVRMERRPDGPGIEFGLLGVELEAAGLIQRKPAPGTYIAYVTCTGCPAPLERRLGWGYGDNCSAAYTAARQNCADMSCTGPALELGCAPTNDDGF